MTTTEKTFGKCTMYTRTAFGYTRKEVTVLTINIKPYAQYPSAVHVMYKEPRQRSLRGFVQTYQPNLVVLDGWGHPDPSSAFTEEEVDSDGVTRSLSRHRSFSEEYCKEFSSFLNAYKEKTKVNVLADFRFHNSYEKVVS
jgi:hypothetical protein